MKRYYAIDWELMHELDISPNEWVFLENITFLQRETGVAFAKKKTLAEHMRMTTRGIQKMTLRLIEKGYIEETGRNGLTGLKTTRKWGKPNQAKQPSGQKQHSSDEANSVPKEANSVPKEANSVPPLPIKNALKGDFKRENTPPKGVPPKEFSFKLKKNTQHGNLSEDYKERLHAYAITHDRAKCLQEMIDWAEASGKGYKDWSAAYRNWVRRQKEFGRDIESPMTISTPSGEVWADYTMTLGTIDGKTLVKFVENDRGEPPQSEARSQKAKSKPTPNPEGINRMKDLLNQAAEGVKV